MTSAEIYWKQIEQLHQYTRHMHQVNSAFFAFAATINVTAAWSLITLSVPLRTPFIPILFIVCDLVAAFGCLKLVFFYFSSYDRIDELLQRIDREHSRNLQLAPTMPWGECLVVAVLFAVVVFLMALAWAFGLYGGYFYNHGPTLQEVTKAVLRFFAG